MSTSNGYCACERESYCTCYCDDDSHVPDIDAYSESVCDCYFCIECANANE